MWLVSNNMRSDFIKKSLMRLAMHVLEVYIWLVDIITIFSTKKINYRVEDMKNSWRTLIFE